MSDDLAVRWDGRAAAQRARRHLWQVFQCGSAAALAWWIAAVVLGHPGPYFAPTAAVIALGISYGQRRRRVIEVAVGVTFGVLLGDLFVIAFGTGVWQIWLVVVIAMTVALALDRGPVVVIQAPVQSLAVCVLVPTTGDGLLRCTDAVIGGACALAVAAIVPASALPRPAAAAAKLLMTVSDILEASAETMRSGDADSGASGLARARGTDDVVLGLRQEVEEAMAVAAQAPARARYRADAAAVEAMVVPLDRLLRSSRGLMRQTAVVAVRHQAVPAEWSDWCDELARQARLHASALEHGDPLEGMRAQLLAIGRSTAAVEPARSVVVQALLVHLRTVIIDLLVLTGLSEPDATAQVPSLDPE